jgi:hypothetical protein
MKLRYLLAPILVLLGMTTGAAAQWTGCGIGVGGAMQYALAGVSDVGIGASGEKAGLTLNCDMRMTSFVGGIEANYDWFFGGLHDTVGAKDELSILGRLGVLTNNANLLYAVAGWGQTSTNDMGKVGSWRVGLGDEFRIPNSPIYLDMRALYIRYDEGDVCPHCTGLKIDGLEAGVRLKLKFGPGMFGGSGPMFTTEDYKVTGTGHDPKLNPGK